MTAERIIGQARLKSAIRDGDPGELRELLAEAGDLPRVLSRCVQAEWLGLAIKAPSHSNELLDLLLDAKFDPNVVHDAIGEDYQSTPFTTAAARARLDLMERLVAAGADIHWRSPSGANAASEALPCRACQAPRPDSPERAAVNAWLAARGVGIDPHCRDSRRKLGWAAYGPASWPDIPGLLNLGMDASLLKWTPVMMKIALGKALPDDVRGIRPELLEQRDCYGRTPFLMAVATGRRDLAGALLEHGADIHARGWFGATALHAAADNNHHGLVAWLVQRGIAVDTRDDQDHPPLKDAVASDHVAAARELVALGAGVRASYKFDHRPIHYARSEEMLALLLDAGAEVNDGSGTGDWPLRSACETGVPDLVRFLLRRGAQPDFTLTGETALFCAVYSDSLDCVRLLLDAGAEINTRDVDGETCLSRLRSLPMADLLLERGADPAIGDLFGDLPEDGIVPSSVRKRLRQRRLHSE